jgi:uncharacterized protein (TIGR01777 family)
MKIIIAGGNGFLGKVLCNHFGETNDMIVLSRGRSRVQDGIRYENWDAKNIGAWKSVLEKADVLINMVGRTVDCRYNEKNKKEILDSRVDSTTVLGNAIRQCQNPPKLWINSASATIYRHAEDREMDEETGEIGSGFSVEVCKAWEKCFFDFQLLSTRQVAVRTSIVLGRTGGAIKPLINLARFGLGGKQGSSNQFFSWIHEEDFARAIEFIINHESITGAINVVSPKPIRNKELMKLIRKSIRMPFGLPLPKCLLEFGARIIRTETELILKSRNVIPGKLNAKGFEYTFGTIEKALAEIAK